MQYIYIYIIYLFEDPLTSVMAKTGSAQNILPQCKHYKLHDKYFSTSA